MLKRLQARLSRAIDVRPGEYARTALMFLYLMCVLLAYYILKPSSRALFLTRFNTDHLPYLYMVMAVSGGILAYFYSRIAVKWSLNAAVNRPSFLSCCACWSSGNFSTPAEAGSITFSMSG
ncbi:MAG: hypothetical protein QM757_05705 [Paludibaculum sp.]